MSIDDFTFTLLSSFTRTLCEQYRRVDERLQLRLCNPDEVAQLRRNTLRWYSLKERSKEFFTEEQVFEACGSFIELRHIPSFINGQQQHANTPARRHPGNGRQGEVGAKAPAPRG